MMRLKKILFISCFCFLTLMQVGCKKLIEVNTPITSVNAGNVYSTDATAAAVLTGIYTTISDLNASLSTGGPTSLSLFPSLSGDELTMYTSNTPIYSLYYRNELSSLDGSSISIFWSRFYQIISICNAAIEGIQGSSSLTPIVKSQLLGEAKFIRAFCYFYLTNLYGSVPVTITTDYKLTASLARSPQNEVYNQIVKDLEEAQDLLNEQYLKADAFSAYNAGMEERLRPTKWAVMALLARVYLFIDDYVNAEKMATAVIDQTALYGLQNLDNTFLKNSREAIWQLQPVRSGTQSNTGDGALFILPESGPNAADHLFYLSSNIMNSFETGDERKSNWTDTVSADGVIYPYAYKYKVGRTDAPTTEYIMVLRLAELYLIRAEARVQQTNLQGGADDLNIIRKRAGLKNTTANTKTGLLAAILHERQVEFFTEWGHRWFDLKRTNTIDAVMNQAAIQKGGTWSPYKALYPIPQSEITVNKNLTQNPGY